MNIFPENFSIGLIVYPKGESGSFGLLRYNGPHGAHVNNLLDPDSHFFGFHIHRAKADNIEKSFSSELYAEVTEHYDSYEEALTHFLKTIKAENANQHFSIQLKLPFLE